MCEQTLSLDTFVLKVQSMATSWQRLLNKYSSKFTYVSKNCNSQLEYVDLVLCLFTPSSVSSPNLIILLILRYFHSFQYLIILKYLCASEYN